MSLDIYEFPYELVDIAVNTPLEEIDLCDYNLLITYLESLKLPKSGFSENKPLVIKLNEDQLNVLSPSLALPTPDSRSTTQTVNTFSLLQLLFVSSLGQPMSISSVRNGAIIQNIFPVDSHRKTPSSSYGSEANFSFHNDLSFLDEHEIPDYVTLGCIRNIEGTVTSVVDVHDILNNLESDVLSELRKPNFSFLHTFHRGQLHEEERTKNSSVITPDNQIRLGVDMLAQTPTAQFALEALRDVLPKMCMLHQLKLGEVLLLPNKYTVHARDAFKAHSNPEHRRWLQRINILT